MHRVSARDPVNLALELGTSDSELVVASLLEKQFSIDQKCHTG